MFNSSLFTKPWFVCAIIFGCFAIITPRILLPMIKQLLGLNQPINRDNLNSGPASSHINRPNMFAGRGGGGGGDAKVPTETLRRQGPIHGAGAGGEHQGSSTSSKSMLAFILPVYTVGIVIYMVYTLCKVYGNKKEPKEQEISTTAKKSANNKDNYQNNIQWDPVKKQFVFKQPDLDTIFADEDVDDNIDDYENLDKDYVKFVKEKRRKEKISEQQQKAASNKPSSDMNNLIIQMKESLNNINIRLAQSDKNRGPTDDDDLQSIKLQLAQTELQMAKVLQTIDSLATNSEDLQEKIKQNLHDDRDGDENDEDAHPQLRHRHHRHRHHKSSKSGKKYKHGSKKYSHSSSDESTGTSTMQSTSTTSATTTSSSESDESSAKSASSSESKKEKKYKKSSKKTHSRHKKSSSNKKRHETKKSKTKIEESSSSLNENNNKNETNSKNECKSSSLNVEILDDDDDDEIAKKSNENVEQLNRYSSQSSSSDIDDEDKKTK